MGQYLAELVDVADNIFVSDFLDVVLFHQLIDHPPIGALGAAEAFGFAVNLGEIHQRFLLLMTLIKVGDNVKHQWL